MLPHILFQWDFSLLVRGIGGLDRLESFTIETSHAKGVLKPSKTPDPKIERSTIHYVKSESPLSLLFISFWGFPPNFNFEWLMSFPTISGNLNSIARFPPFAPNYLVLPK